MESRYRDARVRKGDKVRGPDGRMGIVVSLYKKDARVRWDTKHLSYSYELKEALQVVN